MRKTGRHFPKRAILAPVLLGTAAAVSCREPTQITVVLTTDVACESFGGVRVSTGVLEGLETKPPALTSNECSADGKIGSIAIVPNDRAQSGPVAILVVAGDGVSEQACAAPGYGPGCIVQRRLLSFVPHTALTLPIQLQRSCEGVPCGPEETCVERACRSARIRDSEACTAPSACESWTLPPVDGGTSPADAEPRGRDAAADAPQQVGDAAPLGRCPSGGGVRMVNVGPFCIDTTEATEDAYAAFLASKPSLSSLPSECAGKTSFGGKSATVGSKVAMTQIDWCDAYAYCAWAGKRLCGSIKDPATGKSTFVSEFLYACTGGLKHPHPYGDDVIVGACQSHYTGVPNGPDDPAVVASAPRCECGFPGLFDMTGNVQEWTSEHCDVGDCSLRGGNILDNDDACENVGGAPRLDNGESFGVFGVRCCADVVP